MLCEPRLQNCQIRFSFPDDSEKEKNENKCHQIVSTQLQYEEFSTTISV